MQSIRQGDVILVPVLEIEGQKLSHLTLAEGEVTGHKHRISDGQVELSEKDGTLYLRVFSDAATLYPRRASGNFYSSRQLDDMHSARI